MNIALTVLTYSYLYFFGDLIVNRFKKSNIVNREVSGIPISLFYPLVSLFLIGNFAVVLNFFIPLKYLILPIFLTSGLAAVYWVFITKNNLFNLKNFISIIFIPSILGISSYGVWLGWDTGLYHIPHQLILRENPIIFGLTNLNIWFGWSSINEYLSALLWVGDNFLFLRILEIVFFAVFMNFIFYLIFSKDKFYFLVGLSITVFSFLDNFGYLGGGNGFIPMLSVGKYDSALGILFFLTTFLIFNAMKEKIYSSTTFKFILLMSLFSFQMKQTGVYLILILIPFIYQYIKENGTSIGSFLKLSYSYIGIFILWLAKNIITTSCLFFPIEFTCIPNLSWHEKIQLDFVDTSMIYSPIDFSSSIPIYSQLETWFNFSKNSQFIINFPITLLIIYLTFKFLTISKSKLNKIMYRGSISIFLFINLIFWYNSNYANFRYGTGIWLLIVASIAYYFSYYELNISSRIQNVAIIIFIFSLAQIPRFYSYQEMFLNRLNIDELNIEYNTEYFQSNYGWGVYPSTVQCWDVPECKVEDKNVQPYEYLGKTIFYGDGVSGN